MAAPWKLIPLRVEEEVVEGCMLNGEPVKTGERTQVYECVGLDFVVHHEGDMDFFHCKHDSMCDDDCQFGSECWVVRDFGEAPHAELRR